MKRVRLLLNEAQVGIVRAALDLYAMESEGNAGGSIKVGLSIALMQDKLERAVAKAAQP